MSTRILETDQEREMFVRFINAYKLPCTVEITKGKRRSVEQNRLQRLWMNEIAEQLGDTSAEEVRALCKLTMGVPILRAENDRFAEQYDQFVKPLPYDHKLQIMAEPLDLPVTRLMTTEQKTRYLDHVYRHFTEKGLILTQPVPA